MERKKRLLVRNPFENRKPKRTEINAAKALARAVGAKCYGMMEASSSDTSMRDQDSEP